MLFNSFRFVVFAVIVLAFYYPLSYRLQNRFLLAASIFFYASWDWRFLAPLLFTTSLDFECARRMSTLSAPARRPYLILSVTANLGLLGFFKYFNFFASAAGGWSLEVILPIGISFYTFQALSYTIDVHRGHLHATTSYLDFLLAVLYFPHLVAGPIQRANSLLPQVANPRHPTRENIFAGLHLIIWGYFKKVYIADNLAPLVNQVFAQAHPNGFHVLIAAYAFAFQIYCDFSGYTDIARGLAKLMGFEFMVNFNLPYLAAGPREFWGRWHISLSTWLRDYLYRPLGGNRKGRARTYVNLMITMVLGGLWHGAAWTFILWGFYHGVLVVVYRAMDPYALRIPRWMRVAIFFHLTCYGWLIFRASSLSQLATMTEALFQPSGQIEGTVAIQAVALAVPFLLIRWIQRYWRSLEARSVCYAALLYMTLFCGGRPESFIYFQF